MTRSALYILLISLLLPFYSQGDGPADNIATTVRPIPPLGIEVTAEQTQSLQAGLKKLRSQLDAIPPSPFVSAYLPDAEICYKAVHDALKYGEFFKPGEIDFAFELLKTGVERAKHLAKGMAPWTRETGNVIRGYRSEIDRSVQPYGLEVPGSYDFESPNPTRLDFWFHGRGEKLSEVSFLQQRSSGKGGKISPANTIVLHPYARYSNANKFAGEVDLFEAYASASRDYDFDPDRILVRGFSMGGAACWQFGVHHAGNWAAVQPGAGFSETPDFLKTFQGETLNAPSWEKKLWRWYDATHWAANLTNTATIAYSGEIDRQKQAADMMVAAAEKEGLDLLHIVGPDTAHKFHPDSLEEIESRLSSIASHQKADIPTSLDFVTYTLRYNRIHWARVDRLTEHWEKSRLKAKLVPRHGLEIKTTAIEAFSLLFESGQWPFNLTAEPVVTVDGVELRLHRPKSDRSWEASFKKGKTNAWEVSATIPGERKLLTDWKTSTAPLPETLTKRHGLQGPIDDAFMESFVFVEPTATSAHPVVESWVISELPRAKTHWRKHFRGDAPLRDSSSETDTRNQILWGDPQSNSKIAALMPKLPITWDEKSITVGDQSFDAKNHTLALIYPDPENTNRYVVLNSGFTFREYDYLNNARQTPKLPDWAVINLDEAPSTRYPGKIVAAGFFDENWKLK
jgi:dienelactone hydrolase